jgi:hypothetical protein
MDETSRTFFFAVTDVPGCGFRHRTQVGVASLLIHLGVSWMTSGLIREVVAKLRQGRYVGGGAWIYPERISLGIVCSLLVVAPFVAFRGVSAGLFWFRKRDFDILGGFDESLVSVEDLDFALS